MTRTVTDAKLDSRTARAKLKPSGVPYWRALSPGLHLGYRKGLNGGKWVARWLAKSHPRLARADGNPYWHQTLDGIADDVADADGVTILDFAQAQRRVHELYAAAISPPKPKGPLTVKEAVERYIEFLKVERKTGAEAEGRLAKHVLPLIGDKLVADLTTEDVEKVKRAMVKRDPDDLDAERRSKDTANRILNWLRAALNRAFQDETNAIPSDAAWRRVKSFKSVGKAREVFLDGEESMRLINASSGAFRNLVTAALLTGARPPHELVALRARDFRADLGTLNVPDGKTGRRDVVLTSEATKFFERIAAGKAPDDLLLPKDDGTAWGKNHHIRPMRDAVEKAKLPPDCTIYCLRHTHISQALLNGANLKFIAENTGTSVKMIEDHYGKFIAASRRKLIEEHGFKLGLPDDSKVAPLRKSRRAIPGARQEKTS